MYYDCEYNRVLGTRLQLADRSKVIDGSLTPTYFVILNRFAVRGKVNGSKVTTTW